MEKLSNALCCFNHKYQFNNSVGKEVKVPKDYKPIICPGVRDPNMYSCYDYGHEPFSLRESKKDYLDEFIKTYLVERNNPEEYLDDVVLIREDCKRGQIISIFFNDKKTYKRILIEDKKNFFKLLNFNPNKEYSTTSVLPERIKKLYSMLKDATNIPIQDSDVKYIVEISKYRLEPNEIYSNNELIFS
jgi:hypothetical protein